MHRPTTTALLALLLAAAPAAAEELRFAFGATSAWETEISRGGGGDDLVWQLRPKAILAGDHQRLSYSLEYRPRIEIYTRLSDLDEVSHYLFARSRYQIDRRTSFQVSNAFSLVPSRRRQNDLDRDLEDEGALDETETLVEGRLADNDILTNNFEASLTGRPFRRIQASLGLNHFHRESDGVRGTRTFGGGSRDAVTIRNTLDYVISERMRAGIGFRWRRQENEAVGVGVASDDAGLVSTSYHAFATWSYEPDRNTRISVQVGPSFAEDDRESFDSLTVPVFPRFAGSPERLVSRFGCERVDVNGVSVPILSTSCQDVENVLFMGTIFPQPDLDEDDQEAVANLSQTVQFLPGEEAGSGNANVNVFATLTFQKSWDRWSFLTSYTRSDSQQQGIGSGTVIDAIRSNVEWNPTARWRALLSFRFSRRTTELESGTPVTVLAPSIPVPGLTFIDPTTGTEVPFVGAPAVGLATLDSTRSFNVDTFTIRARAQRRMSRRFNLFTEARWRLDSAGGDLVRDDIDRYEIRFGFNYSFRPIRL